MPASTRQRTVSLQGKDTIADPETRDELLENGNERDNEAEIEQQLLDSEGNPYPASSDPLIPMSDAALEVDELGEGEYAKILDEEGNEQMLDDEEEDVDVDSEGEQIPELDVEPSSEDTRSEEELEAIRYEIMELESEIDISKQYKIIDRLGEGTFSSVYKAIDCSHPFYNNSKWAPESGKQLPSLHSLRASSVTSERGVNNHVRNSSSSSSSAPIRESPYSSLLTARKHLKALSSNSYSLTREEGGSPVYVALKRIYVTSSPQRIANELDILAELRDARCTAYLVSAIRHEDQVIAVMPYEKHQDFRTYYRTLPLPAMQSYLKCLLSALSDCHAKGIIHRDVKPANFLFNVSTNSGTLCDFGLAQRFNPAEWHSRCLHAMPVLWKRYIDPSAGVHGAKLSRPEDLWLQLQNSQAEFFENEDSISEAVGKEIGREIDPADDEFDEEVIGPWLPGLGYTHEKHKHGFTNRREIKELKERIKKEDWLHNWRPVMKHPQNVKVGFMKPECDRRPQIRANRAGTRGFRAPEVVLKCPDQTMALDIWSVGVTLLCFLTRRFPFFASNDDTEALMEIATIFGKKRVEKCAALHNRTFITNIPSIETPRFKDLHELVRSLNPNIFIESMPKDVRSQYSLQHGINFYNDPETIRNLDHSSWYDSGTELYCAVDLMKRCMTLDLTRRITARDALNHPFITGSWREAQAAAQ